MLDKIVSVVSGNQDALKATSIISLFSIIQEELQIEYSDFKSQLVDLFVKSKLSLFDFSTELQKEVEMFRLDMLEASLWELYRTQHEAEFDRIIDKVIVENDSGGFEEVVANIREHTKNRGRDPRVLAQIASVQAERRKLLDIYPSNKVDVNATINIKGYVNVSPDDWQ